MKKYVAGLAGLAGIMAASTGYAHGDHSHIQLYGTSIHQFSGDQDMCIYEIHGNLFRTMSGESGQTGVYVYFGVQDDDGLKKLFSTWTPDEPGEWSGKETSDKGLDYILIPKGKSIPEYEITIEDANGDITIFEIPLDKLKTNASLTKLDVLVKDRGECPQIFPLEEKEA